MLLYVAYFHPQNRSELPNCKLPIKSVFTVGYLILLYNDKKSININKFIFTNKNKINKYTKINKFDNLITITNTFFLFFF